MINIYSPAFIVLIFTWWFFTLLLESISSHKKGDNDTLCRCPLFLAWEIPPFQGLLLRRISALQSFIQLRSIYLRCSLQNQQILQLIPSVAVASALSRNLLEYLCKRFLQLDVNNFTNELQEIFLSDKKINHSLLSHKEKDSLFKFLAIPSLIALDD